MQVALLLPPAMVVDGNMITWRKPDELPAFCCAIVGEAQHIISTDWFRYYRDRVLKRPSMRRRYWRQSAEGPKPPGNLFTGGACM